MKEQFGQRPGMFLLLGLAGLPVILLLVMASLIWFFAMVLNFSSVAGVVGIVLAIAYFPALIGGEILVIRRYQSLKREMKST